MTCDITVRYSLQTCPEVADISVTLKRMILFLWCQNLYQQANLSALIFTHITTHNNTSNTLNIAHCSRAVINNLATSFLHKPVKGQNSEVAHLHSFYPKTSMHRCSAGHCRNTETHSLQILTIAVHEHTVSSTMQQCGAANCALVDTDSTGVQCKATKELSYAKSSGARLGGIMSRVQLLGRDVAKEDAVIAKNEAVATGGEFDSIEVAGNAVGGPVTLPRLTIVLRAQQCSRAAHRITHALLRVESGHHRHTGCIPHGGRADLISKKEDR